jgi:hypothetical protein
VVQQQWASVDYRKNMSMIGQVRIGGHQEIVAIGSYADESDVVAEVAFVVREDFQGMGIGSYSAGGSWSVSPRRTTSRPFLLPSCMKIQPCFMSSKNAIPMPQSPSRVAAT